MTTIQQVCEYLDDFAPPSLAEEWDNVGLLIGAAERPVRQLMTCLTITPASAAEAVARGVNLIVTHHPLPFRPLKRITNETVTGRLLLTLIESQIAVFSPHTAFDSACRGINQRLAEAMELANIEPLVTDGELPGAGSGAWECWIPRDRRRRSCRN